MAIDFKVGLTEQPTGLSLDNTDDASQPRLASRWRRHTDGLAFLLATSWIALVVLAAILANLLPLRRFDVIVPDLPARMAPHFGFTEPLGTDVLGRSVLSRLVFGARQSLTIGTSSALIAMSVGLLVGVSAGYLQGLFDRAIAVILDAVLSIPAVLLLLAVASVGRRSTVTIVLGLGTIGVPFFARLARTNTMLLSAREYVTAARALGATRTRVMARELLPGVALRTSPLFFLFIAFAIVAEATLSFLGLGVPPPTPSWGGMVSDAQPYLSTQAYLIFIPAGCILLTVASFSVIGDRIRSQFDRRGWA